MTIELILGDCLKAMKKMPDNSIETIITDPPYGLEFMGKSWDKVVPGIPFWSEMFRIAKPGAILMAMGGTRTYHRLVCAIEDSGWLIRDTIIWAYGTGLPKSLDISKAIDKRLGRERKKIGRYQAPDGASRQARKVSHFGSKATPSNYDITAPSSPEAQLWEGWGSNLKPAFEPICLAMKPLDGDFAENAMKWGVSGLWLDGGRIELTEADKAVPRLNKPYIRKGDNNFGGGKDKRQGTTTGYKSKGRHPTNLIHSGCEDILDLFPNTGHGNKSGETAARFFYCAKPSRKEKDLGLDGSENRHPTTKPISLFSYLVRLTKTPTGGTVLDPFMGSGTTGIACINEDRSFIGIEQSEEYFEIAEKRIEYWQKQKGCFDE